MAFALLRRQLRRWEGYAPVRPSTKTAFGADIDDDGHGGPGESAGRARPSALFSISTAIRVLLFLLPSFVANPARQRLGLAKPARRKQLHATAYLDGLRGVAALIVYVFHFGYLWFPSLRHGYGSTPEDVWLAQLPVVRALHSGRASVTVFFVISGYVLSAKPLATLRAGRADAVFDLLAGGLFRRPLRLYLPIFVQTLIILVLVRLGLFVANPPGQPGSIPPFANSLADQLEHWWGQFWQLVNPFQAIAGRFTIPDNQYDGHLWTIPVEFKGSVLVFALLLVFSRTKRWASLAGLAGAVAWLIHVLDYDMALFAGGVFLVELSLLVPPAAVAAGSWASAFRPRGLSSRAFARLSHALRHAATLTLFAVCIWLFSYPETNGPSTPGFRTLSALTPKGFQRGEDWVQFFWIATGALLFVPALMYSPPPRLPRPEADDDDVELGSAGERLLPASAGKDDDGAARPAAAAPGEPLLQRIFTTRLAQYLGEVSFALYLAHDSVSHVLGMRFLRPAWDVFNVDLGDAERVGAVDSGQGRDLRAVAYSRYVLAAAWGVALNTVVLFWVSDLFTRLVDAKAIRFARRVQQWVWATT